jgi:hypothetical protein
MRRKAFGSNGCAPAAAGALDRTWQIHCESQARRTLEETPAAVVGDTAMY